MGIAATSVAVPQIGDVHAIPDAPALYSAVTRVSTPIASATSWGSESPSRIPRRVSLEN